jgi:hypothetical protein
VLAAPFVLARESSSGPGPHAPFNKLRWLEGRCDTGRVQAWFRRMDGRSGGKCPIFVAYPENNKIVTGPSVLETYIDRRLKKSQAPVALKGSCT